MSKQYPHLIKNVLLVILPLLIYSLLLSIPLPHNLGLSLRYDFGVILIPLVLVFILVFHKSGVVGEFLAITCVLVCFSLPLSGLWASGQSEQYLLGGLIPYSDADHYFIDASALLDGKLFSVFTARRPIFAGLLSVLLGGTDQNLQITLAILVVICAFSCFLFAREIQATHGTLVAVFIFLFLFFFFRPIIGKTLTENLGLPLGILGASFLWRSVAHHKHWYAILGIFLVSLALNVRAGAFFVLPMLVLWAAVQFRNGSKFPLSPIIFVLSSLAVLSAFIINMVIFRILAGDGAPFGNFAHTLYGFASGGNGWAQIYYDHDSEIRNASGAEQNNIIYQLAFKKMNDNPSLMLTGIMKSWKAFFDLNEFSSFCFIGGENPLVAISARLILYALSLITLISWLIKRDGYRSLAVATFFGILLSVPFAPPIDANRMRAYAATIPLFGLMPLLGLSFTLEKFRILNLFESKREQYHLTILPIFTFVLLLVSLIVPPLVGVFSTSPQYEETHCAAEEQAVILRFNRGSYINIVADNAITRDWLPDIRLRYFVNRVHNLPHSETFGEFDNIREGTTIFEGINLKDNSRILVFTETQTLPSMNGIYQFCGNFTVAPNPLTSHFFYAESNKNVGVTD